MPYLSQNIIERLDEKLRRLEQLRPLPQAAVAKLKEQFAIEMTYNSNAIEGNKLTLKETFLVISEGLTIKGKSLKDHLEAKDHYEALNYLYEFIERGSRQSISEVFIRNLNQLVLRETDKEWAGRYRTSNVIITGSDHTPPDASAVPAQIREVISWFKKTQKKSQVIELAAILHHKLVYTHPFFDGNGRTARLAMNLVLLQVGYPLVVILRNDRKKYYETLAQADKNHYAAFVNFIAQAVERSLNMYLKTLLPAAARPEQFVPLAVISEQTPYSKKYLNLLARQGKIEAHKERRNWVTSLEAVKRYLAGRKRQR